MAADVALYRGDVVAAEEHYTTQVVRARAADDRIRLVWTLYYVAICHAVRRVPELGVPAAQECLAVARDRQPDRPVPGPLRAGAGAQVARAQAAGAIVDYDPATGRYSLPAEHAVALTDETSPAFLPGFFQIAQGTVADAARILDAARGGGGLGWHEHNSDVHIGCERLFRPGYAANLVPGWLPALDGVTAKLEAGAAVADVGCGHGASTVLMAQAYPWSWFVGSDYHPESIAIARARAAEAGVADRVRFEVADAASFTGRDYDLVTMFDCLHDMGDPVGAARHVRETIAEDGTWMVVEPRAGDRVEDNLNAVGRVYYGFSTLLCTPSSLAQPVGLGLGTQAGPARIRAVTEQAGFTRFDQAAQTPFNMVLEVRL